MMKLDSALLLFLIDLYRYLSFALTKFNFMFILCLFYVYFMFICVLLFSHISS